MIQETDNSHTKTCLECGRLLGAGRSDRKFCNDICRTAYNNLRRADIISEQVLVYDPEQLHNQQNEHHVQKIINILHENRAKLMNIFGPGDHVISLSDFYGYGVNLKYFTSEYKEVSEGYIYRMSFDYGYHIDR